MIDGPAVLEVNDVQKVYASGTHALKGVSMAVAPGAVLGLIGANGAGKSTLIRIICGSEQPTSGTVAFQGHPVVWNAPSDALTAGLATVHQHAPLVESMTVLDNVFLGQSRGGGRWDAAARQVELDALCERIGYELDGEETVAALSVGARQMVAILQALSREPALVLLDEPTAALSPGERAVLFRSVRRLTADGISFVFVSHFLDEVLHLTDHLTVLRDGRVVVDQATSATSEQDLITAIVGERLARLETATAPRRPQGEPLLKIRGLSSPGRFGPVDLTVHEGEVVGLAGLLGSGRTELLEAIFGADSSSVGTVTIGSVPIRAHSPTAAVRAGLALVPEDRNRQGLLRDWEIWRNISLPYLTTLSVRKWFPSSAREEELAVKAISDLNIIAPNADAPARELSGGNAQKVVFAKWLYGPAKVFLLDEPAAGVDVGAKADIIQLITRLAESGHGIIIVASEFEELLAASDRVLVLRRGRIVAERIRDRTDLHELTALASGL